MSSISDSSSGSADPSVESSVTQNSSFPIKRSAAAAAALALVFFLGACGGGSETSESTADEPANTAPAVSGGVTTDKVEISEFNFKPGSITVKAGTTVTWTNLDNFAHTVKVEGAATGESPKIEKGGTFGQTFDKSGSFPYICGIHNSMTGTITVT